MIKAVIFDVDGTLVDSVAIHAKAWQEAFAAFGHEISFEELRGQIGKGGDQLLPVFLSKEQLEAQGEQINARRAEIIKEQLLRKIDAFPMVRALFERLRGDGIKIALASSAKGDELETYKKKATSSAYSRKRLRPTMLSARSLTVTSSRRRSIGCLASPLMTPWSSAIRHTTPMRLAGSGCALSVSDAADSRMPSCARLGAS